MYGRIWSYLRLTTYLPEGRIRGASMRNSNCSPSGVVSKMRRWENSLPEAVGIRRRVGETRVSVEVAARSLAEAGVGASAVRIVAVRVVAAVCCASGIVTVIVRSEARP